MIKVLCVDFYGNIPVFGFKSLVIPRVGEIVYGPHNGSYIVTKVIYQVSDDAPGKITECNDEIMWVECIVEKEM